MTALQKGIKQVFRRRNMKTWVRFLLLVVLLVGVTGTSLALMNAYQTIHKEEASGKGKIKGVSGTIAFSNPDLNGGRGSYHRVVMFNEDYNTYNEVGWIKTDDPQMNKFGNYFLNVYGSFTVQSRQYQLMPSPEGTYKYVIEHEKWLGTTLNVHTAKVYDLVGNLVFSHSSIRDSIYGLKNNTAHRMSVGGEVAADTENGDQILEEMVGPEGGYGLWGTDYVELQWLRKEKSTGNLVWKKWANPDSQYEFNETPYDSLYLGYSTFGGFLRTCGESTALNC